MSGRLPVDESDDDVFHVDVGMEISTRSQEATQCLQVKLIREDLTEKHKQTCAKDAKKIIKWKDHPLLKVIR